MLNFNTRKEGTAIPHRPILHVGRCTLAATMEGKFPLNPHYGAGEELRGNLLTTIFTYLGKEAAQVYVNVAATTIFDELLPLVESGREQVTVTVDFKDASQD